KTIYNPIAAPGPGSIRRTPPTVGSPIAAPGLPDCDQSPGGEAPMQQPTPSLHASVSDPWWKLIVLAAAAWALLPPPSRAQEGHDAGLVVQVPTLITTEATNRLRTTVSSPLKRFEAERAGGKKGRTFRLVCDFNPDNRTSASDDFGACLNLANYLA